MPESGPVEDFDQLSDGDLLERVRAGDDEAFGALYLRYAPAVRAYATRNGAVGADVDDLAAEAFFRVLQSVRKGSGPVRHARGYLMTVTRRVAAEWATRRREVALTDEDPPVLEPPIDRVERALITTAFTSLPERWRAVLWRVEVEGERPAVVARHFGLSANATAALARRARHGLRAAYLQAHLSTVGSSNGCRGITEKLGAYTAGGLRGSETRRVRAHLASCAACQSLQAELAEVCFGLRVHASALLVPAGITALLAQYGGGAGAGKAVALKASTLTLRTKVGVVAASASAVGAFGLSAGPLLGADRAELALEGRHNVIAVSPQPSGQPTGKPTGEPSRGGDSADVNAPDPSPGVRLGPPERQQPPKQPERTKEHQPRTQAANPDTAAQPQDQPVPPPADDPPTQPGLPTSTPRPLLTTQSYAPPAPLLEVTLLPLTEELNPGPVRPPGHDQPIESHAPAPQPEQQSPSARQQAPTE